MQDESPLNPLDLEQSPSSSLPSPKSHLQFTSQLCICAVLCICAKRNWNREQVELCAPIFRPVLSNPVFFWQEFTFASAVQNKHSGTARLPIRVQLPQINKISVECNSCNISTYLYKISPSWRKCLFFVVLAGGWKLYHDKLLMLMNLDQRHWYAARLAIFAHFETWDLFWTRSAQQFAISLSGDGHAKSDSFSWCIAVDDTLQDLIWPTSSFKNFTIFLVIICFRET